MRIKKYLEIVRFYFKQIAGVRTRPKVIQLPVTSKCNSRCLTCNVWKIENRSDIDPLALQIILKDTFFSQVEAVGINGGEVSLYKTPDILIESLFSLPKLKTIYVISNGLLPNKLLPILKQWKYLCSQHNIKISVTISVDGYGEVHDVVRGIPNAFDRTIDTLSTIKNDIESYCDRLAIGCTISKHNIKYISLIETYLNSLGLPVEYHLAVPNKRIGTFEQHPYSVMEDEASRLLATEYFYGKFCSTRRLAEKVKYFMQYHYLVNRGIGRLSSCPYQKRDVTIDENLNLYLCATASDKITNLKDMSATKAMRTTMIKDIEKQVFSCCDTCIHYVSALPTIKGWLIFASFIIKNRLKYVYKFKYLSIWQRL